MENKNSHRTNLHKIAIIGGGIGGLNAALCLLQKGFDVHVYEQASSLGEVGAGIVISPNASRILHGLGLEGELSKKGVRALEWVQRRWDNGRVLLKAPIGDVHEKLFGFPHYQLHRADLLNILSGAFPADRIHVGHRCTGFVDHGDHVEVRFENGFKTVVDALVGADGIHSMIRKTLFGNDKPHFTGCVAYRGLIPADQLRDLHLENTRQIWMGPGGHFAHYFVRGGELVNFVAHVEKSAWTRESWTETAEISDVLRPFTGWHPQIQAIIEKTNMPFAWALFDREPLSKWSVGRVTLLGDACHPMLPYMGQGAVQAIEDGATLAAVLTGADEPDVSKALHLYEQIRLPRTSRIQKLSASNKARFHLPDGPEQRERDKQMESETTDYATKAVAWIYEYDASVLPK